SLERSDWPTGRSCGPPGAASPATNTTAIDGRGLPGHGRRRARGAVARPHCVSRSDVHGVGGPTMSRAPWVTHFGFTRTPSTNTSPAEQLCDRASHQEVVARIRFCVSESLLGVITGEVGVGKNVAVRAATSQLEATAHHMIYVATPTFGARGLYL